MKPIQTLLIVSIFSFAASSKAFGQTIPQIGLIADVTRSGTLVGGYGGVKF